MNIIISGQARAGKNYLAEQAGFDIYGFADPIYEIVEALYGSRDKSKPRIRPAMQRVGQWGRGQVDEQYPETVERTLISEWIVCNGKRIVPEVNWQLWGRDDFWVQAMLSRVKGKDNVAIVNGRFLNEIEAFKEQGYMHVHVFAPDEDLRARRNGADDPSGDISEQMAQSIDESIYARHYLAWEQDNYPKPELIVYNPNETDKGGMETVTYLNSDPALPSAILLEDAVERFKISDTSVDILATL